MNVTQIQNILVGRLHGTLQGPVVEGQERDERSGELYHVLTWEVANGTRVEKDLPHGWKVDIAPVNISKSRLVLKISRKRKTDDTYEDGYPIAQLKSVGQESLTPAEFRKFVTQKETATKLELAKEAVNDIPAVAALAGDQTQIAHRKLNDEEYLQIVKEEILLEGVDPLEGEQVGIWGIESTEKSLIAEGDPVDFTYGVKDSKVRPLGNGKSVKDTIIFPADVDGVVGYILDEDIDAQTGIITDVTKMLVHNDQLGSVKALWRGQVQPWFVEAKGQDQLHTVLIASRIDLSSLPADEVYWTSENVRLPDMLQSMSVLWNPQVGGGNGTAFDEGGNGFSGRASASATASMSPSIGLYLKAGFSGRTKARVTRSYVYGVPETVAEPFNINPATGTVTLMGASFSFSASVSKTVTNDRKGTSLSNQVRVGSNTRVIQIGPFLNSGVAPIGESSSTASSGTYYGSNQGTFAYANAEAEGKVIVTLGLSTPSSIASGSLVARYQVPQRWRLGVWVVETVEIFAP